MQKTDKMNLDFEYSSKAKTVSFVLIGIGLLALAYGIFTEDGTHGTRLWSNIYLNSFFFFGISLASLFFLTLQYAAQAAWGTVLKRVFEAFTTFIPVGSIFLVIVFLAGTLHYHHIFHWMDTEVYYPFISESGELIKEYQAGASENPHYDAILDGKSAYLNQPFFWIRTLTYLAIFIFFARLFRKRSLEEDLVGGNEYFFKNVQLAAIFLVLFAITSSTLAWDWLMSIDPHWFSTLYGWYAFSGYWASAMIAIVLMTIFLKSQGYLEFVNENHVHDMGKWMFATNFLWCYLYFSQYELIWYSNIPEEVTYFLSRIENYKGLMIGVFAINLVLPLFGLMSRDSKRSYTTLAVIGSILFITHWLDFLLMIFPGAVNDKFTGVGFLEIGMFLGFLGLFLFVVFNSLTKAPLLVKNHPYLEESKHHHI